MFSVLEEVMKNTHRFNFFCFLLKVWSQFSLGDSWELAYISAGLTTKHFNVFFRDSWGNLRGMKITSQTPQAPCEFSHYCLLQCQNHWQWTWVFGPDFLFYFLGTTTGYFLLEMFGIGSKLGSLIQWKNGNKWQKYWSITGRKKPEK